MKIVKAPQKILEAALDLRFLLSRGYTREVALKFVSCRYGLTSKEQRILYRGVYDDRTANRHRQKKININYVKNQKLAIDWYNVYITVDSGLTGDTIILCDDGFIRDVRGVHGKVTRIDEKNFSLRILMECLSELSLGEVEIVLDSMVSWSGELKNLILKVLKDWGIEGRAYTSKKPDVQLMKYDIVATSDSVIIERVDKILDLPEIILSKFDVEAITLK